MVGIDEVGLSAIAGPIVIGATRGPIPGKIEVKDSKQLKPQERLEIGKQLIEAQIDYSIIILFPQFVLHRSLVDAVMLGAYLALKELNVKPNERIIIDGKNNPKDYFKKHDSAIYDEIKSLEIIAMPKADEFIREVSAASILAKIFRDKFMELLHPFYPEYNWKQNKGYYSRRHFDEATKKMSFWHRERLIYQRKKHLQLKLLKEEKND
ncbi:MAG: hypothetical protein QW228_01125 [Candidatus Aenigmatarchaeota archaeon]